MSTGFYILLSTVTVCSTITLLVSAYKLDQQRKGGATPPAAHRSRPSAHVLPRSILS